MLAAACCGLVVTAAEPITIRALRRLSAIDIPGLRSSHSVPTPRGGGAPIVAGLLGAMALIRGAPAIPFGAAVGFFGAVGFADDLRGLTPRRRLALQAAGSTGVAALLAVPLRLQPAMLAAAIIVIAVWLMGFVNAFNFMDGVNGISAAHAMIGGVAYACFGEARRDPFLVASGLALAAGALAFLPWNVVRARVFLGDVGSYALGAALAVLAVRAVTQGIPAEAALGPVALYLADTAWTLQRRIRADECWLEAHRTHTYQRWCDAGWSHQEVALLTAATSVLLSLLGAVSLSGNSTARGIADLIAMGLLVAYLRSPALFRRLGLPAMAERPGDPAAQREPELQGEPS